jgi:hypothetical protein
MKRAKRVPVQQEKRWGKTLEAFNVPELGGQGQDAAG